MATGTEPGRPLKVFIVAGEPSGDSHGAGLAKALKELDPTVELSGLGGPLLEAAGMPTPFDFVAHATMGLIPVLKKLPFFSRTFNETVARLEREKPDVLVPIDYPGFNLRLARRAKKLGIFVCYYVSPQIWAWAPWRIKKVARAIDHMMCLFPFEKTFYEKHSVPVTFVGHPIFDALRAEQRIAGFRESIGASPTDPIVALLPGSRGHEIEHNLPFMLATARAVHARSPEARFLVPCANPRWKSTIEESVAKHGQGLPVLIFDGQAREIARRARVAIVTSGTATLELLFHEVPMVVVYRVAEWQLAIAKRFLLTVAHIALVNILADREVVPEFLGEKFTPEDVAETALELLRDGRARKKCLGRLSQLKREVSAAGASRRAAETVLACARQHASR